jgi:hypothetical protein
MGGDGGIVGARGVVGLPRKVGGRKLRGIEAVDAVDVVGPVVGELGAVVDKYLLRTRSCRVETLGGRVEGLWLRSLGGCGGSGGASG